MFWVYEDKIKLRSLSRGSLSQPIKSKEINLKEFPQDVTEKWRL